MNVAEERQRIDGFLDQLWWELCENPRGLARNVRGASAFTTWTKIVLVAPQGLHKIAQDYLESHGGSPLDRYRRPAVASLIAPILERAPYVICTPAGRAIHRARIVHPDKGRIERRNALLIDLDLVERSLEPYGELLFQGAVEIYDREGDQPLIYPDGSGGWVRRATPPGFKTVADLKREGLLRTKKPADKRE